MHGPFASCQFESHTVASVGPFLLQEFGWNSPHFQSTHTAAYVNSADLAGKAYLMFREPLWLYGRKKVRGWGLTPADGNCPAAAYSLWPGEKRSYGPGGSTWTLYKESLWFAPAAKAKAVNYSFSPWIYFGLSFHSIKARIKEFVAWCFMGLPLNL